TNFSETEVKVPVRIIVAQDTEFENITVRTNTQNGLDTKDLVSINSIQKDIEYEFSQKLFLGKKFYYKRQKSNEKISDEIDYVVQVDDVLRTVFSTLMLRPDKVSGYFDRTTSKYIDQVFDEYFIKLYTILTVLYKLVEDYIDSNDSLYSRLKYHICFLIYKFTNKESDLSIIESYLRDSDKDKYTEEEIMNLKELIEIVHSNIYLSISNEANLVALIKYVMQKIADNYSALLDLSTKEKEKIIYKAVTQLPRIRVTPVFNNFDDIFTDDYKSILNNNATI
ncbi:MAG: AIPR family protein, partial [Tannerella sp.]|nr:AIPR family protein [Tannerella sp.]